MNTDSNPGLESHLPEGMSEEKLREAVDLSGYPLQTVVAGALADREYRVEEEWAWRDPEGERQRTLDILAEGGSRHWHESEQGRVQVIRSLLIECKQSRNPYLGFAAVSPPLLNRHPPVIGLRPEIAVRPEAVRTPSTSFSLLHLLGLRHHPYLREPLAVSALSRAHRNGKRVEMSGDEPFNSLVRPLTKAARMFQLHWSDPRGLQNQAIVARLVFPIAVIDAPLLGILGRRGATEIVPTDWMRIFARHPAGANRGVRLRRLGFDVVDLVTASYFDTFLEERLVPFVDEFTSSLAEVQDCVLSGNAVLPGYEPGQALPYNWLTELRPL